MEEFNLIIIFFRKFSSLHELKSFILGFIFVMFSTVLETFTIFYLERKIGFNIELKIDVLWKYHGIQIFQNYNCVYRSIFLWTVTNSQYQNWSFMFVENLGFELYTLSDNNLYQELNVAMITNFIFIFNSD